MQNDGYINLVIQKILELQGENQNYNIDQNLGLNPEQTLISKILDPRKLEGKGKYNIPGYSIQEY